MRIVKKLIKTALALSLVGLLLLPGNSMYVISASAIDATKLSQSVNPSGDAGFEEDVGLLEEAGISEEVGIPEEITDPSGEKELSEKAGIPSQPLSLLTVERITSTNADGSGISDEQPNSIPPATSKSLWFKDPNSTQIIRTYN